MRRISFFSVIVLMFYSLFASGQFTDSTIYDFRDGTIITNGQSADGSLKLGGTYSLHGATYGLDMKVDGTIDIAIGTSSTLRFLGSAYSGLNLECKTTGGGDWGTHDTKVTNDLTDTYDFVYDSAPDTLRFKTLAGTGNDLYLPYIEVVPEQPGGDSNLISAVKNIIYYFDLRDGSIIPNDVSLNGNYTIDTGLFKIEPGPSNAYGYNGAQHGSIIKTGNKITLKVAGNSYIKVGGCQYSSGTISVSSATGDFDVTSQQAQTTNCYDVDSSSVDFLYAGSAGEVVLDFTGTIYIPIIKIVPVPFDVTLNTYVQKSGTIILDNDTIDLTSGATASDLPTITIGDSSNGVLISSTAEEALIALDMGGIDPSTLIPTFTGDIDTVIIVDSLMTVLYTDSTTDPLSYKIVLYDNSYLHGVYNYDFRDGSIITNGKSADSTLRLSGTYSLHGATYGLDMKVDGTIDIIADDDRTFKFLGSQYSGLNLVGTSVTQGDLGTQNTQVINDLSDTYDFVYDGSTDTLNFKTTAGSGNDLYLPVIDVYPSQFGAAYTSSVKNIIYYFDFRDGTIVPTTTTGTSDISKGLVDIIVGSSNAYGYNGTQHGSVFKEGNQIVLDVAGNCYIKVGGSIYSNGTISISSATGDFDLTSQPSQTTGNYGNDGSTVDFLYAGTAGTITLDFTGTNYVPVIKVVPVPYDVILTPWTEKSGTITVNGTNISLTAGASASDNAIVTVDSGTVISSTAELASVRIDLNGSSLASYTPSFTGNISSVTISGDTLLVAYADSSSLPFGYKIVVADNSLIVEAEPGKTYTYNFADGSVLPQTSYSTLRYSTFVTDDGILTLNSNTATESLQFGYHDSQHGAVFFPGNSMDIIVAGNATITFIVCTYGSATDAVFEFKDDGDNILGSVPAQNIGGADGYASSFSYTGPAGVITATLKSPLHSSAEVYIHGLSIENAALIEPSNGKIDVWDFGAEQFDTATYNNKLTEDIINAWYDGSITVGSSGNVLPGFSEGVLSWVGGSNDRLRTTNTNLTRYDENISGVSGYTGRVYVNSSANTGRFMSLTLNEDDEVIIIALSQNGSGRLNFEYVPDPDYQTDLADLGADATEFNFAAKQAGTYHIYDDKDKPSYYRIYRKDADYVTINGTVDVTQASGIPAGYGINFENEAGKVWNSVVSSNAFSVIVPAGYTYSLSLSDANGYVISNGTTLDVTESTTTYNVAIEKVELYTVSGAITGLDSAQIANMTLVYTPDTAAHKIYVPEPVTDAGAATYSVQLEPECKYIVSALGINDYYIPNDSVTIAHADSTIEIAFALKPVYDITIEAPDLTTEQLGKLNLTFTNLNESGYVYTFNSVDNIALRDGVYSIDYSGLDAYPVKLALTSNLVVDGANATKTLTFEPITVWSFDDKAIVNGDTAYNGLLFTGTVYNEQAKGHLVGKPDATIKVPV